MRIRSKITLGYLLITFLVTVIGYAGMLNIKKTETESGRAIEGSIKTIQVIHNLRYYGLDLIANTTEILFLQAESRGSNISELAAGPSEIGMLREKTLHAFDQTLTQYAHLSDRSNSGRRDHIANIRNLSEQLKMRSVEIITVVSRPVRPESEVLDATRRLGEVRTVFTKAIDEALAYENQQMDGQHRVVEAAIDRSYDVSTGVTVLSLLGAVFLGGIIARALSRPIVEL